jgi:hypothetical protein
MPFDLGMRETRVSLALPMRSGGVMVLLRSGLAEKGKL